MIWIVGSVVIVSLLSLIGIFTLSLNKKLMNKILFYAVSFSAGTLFGDAFLHLLPESVEEFGFTINTSFYLLSGVLGFFVIEKIIHWHHCHNVGEEVHANTFTYMNLVGDAIHNFVDGMIIAGSYLASLPVGIATTLAVIFHEIPQEISEFGILIYGGLEKNKALMFNFMSALTAVLGALVTVFLAGSIENLESALLPFTAGAFIYIAGSDLIPELHKETQLSVSIKQFIFFLMGIGAMWLLLGLE